LHFGFVPFGAQFGQPGKLGFTNGGVIHLKDFHGVFFGKAIFIDAHDHVGVAVDLGLTPGRGFFDAHFGQPGLDGFGHAAQLFHFHDVVPGFLHDGVGEGFHIVGTRPGIDDFGDVGFVLQIELGVAGYAGREIGGQSDGLIQRIGMQGLGVSQSGGQGFDASAGHVVVGVLLREAPSRGL